MSKLSANVEIRQVKTEQELAQLLYQRWLVLRSPLGLPQGSERDRYDAENAVHLVAIHANLIVGSARLRSISPTIGSIAYLAVLPEFQQQGIGSALIEHLIALAKQKSFLQLQIMSRKTAVPFYKRFGFVEGESIDRLGIPHIIMHLSELA